jgi:hypothetical protein
MYFSRFVSELIAKVKGELEDLVSNFQSKTKFQNADNCKLSCFLAHDHNH